MTQEKLGKVARQVGEGTPSPQEGRGGGNQLEADSPGVPGGRGAVQREGDRSGAQKDRSLTLLVDCVLDPAAAFLDDQ